MTSQIARTAILRKGTEMSRPMSYKKALQIVLAAGMDVEDGLAFTVCGGQLVTGEDAADHIKEVNGCDVYQAAEAILEAEARPS